MITDWTQALCLQVDPDLWFPEKGHADLARAAKRICATCPIQLPCARLGEGEVHGVWGGISRNGRLRRQREEAA